ncbi:hypothetical protein [Allobranchiibius sp. GilTou73]|nr:hypothetical protein [Allobranchiibius sp. GilTou73]
MNVGADIVVQATEDVVHLSHGFHDLAASTETPAKEVLPFMAA